jgi:hypothetical protein
MAQPYPTQTHTANLSHLISVEEYLNTTYRPDVDYIDGEIEERNWGEFDHGDVQFGIANLLRNKQQEWNIRVVGETRTQVVQTVWIFNPETRTAHVCSAITHDRPQDRHPPRPRNKDRAFRRGSLRQAG